MKAGDAGEVKEAVVEEEPARQQKSGQTNKCDSSGPKVS